MHRKIPLPRGWNRRLQAPPFIDSHSLDGIDLAKTAAGETGREVVFSQWEQGPLGCYMAVTEDWKYFYSAPDDREYLFDRRADPLETRNVAGASHCREPHHEIKESLIQHLREGGESAALEGDGWRKYPYVP